MPKIIDAHTHIGFNDIINAKPSELLASMNHAGISAAMVFAGKMNDCSNKKPFYAIADLNKPQKRLHAIGSVSPLEANKPALEDIEMLLETHTIRGLKFYTGYEHYYPNDRCVIPYLKLLAKYRRPAIFHSGDCYNKCGHAKLKYAHPLHIDDIATDIPDLPIIIAHFGWPHVTEAALVAYKNKNVFVDCSGLVYGKFDRRSTVKCMETINTFCNVFDHPSDGYKKIVFGSDWPICNQESYVATIQSLFPEEALENIFHDNANRLFGPFEQGDASCP